MPRCRMQLRTNARVVGTLLQLWTAACSDGPEQPAERSKAQRSEARSLAAGAEQSAQAGATAAVMPMPMPIVCSGELPVMRGFDAQANMEIELDWSCYPRSAIANGDTTDPVDTANPTAATLKLTYAPVNALPVSDVKIDQFFGPSALGTPAYSGLTDKAGQITFPAPAEAQRLSLWQHATRSDTDPVRDTLDVYSYGVPIAWSPNVVVASAIISAYVDILYDDVLGSRELGDHGKAMIDAIVRDCNGKDVTGALLELVDSTTNEPVAESTQAGEPRAAYTRYALPDKTCTFTTAPRSEWIMVNAPVNVRDGALSHPYKVRAKGRMRASDREPVILDERAVELHAGAFSYVHPYRLWPAIP